MGTTSCPAAWSAPHAPDRQRVPQRQVPPDTPRARLADAQGLTSKSYPPGVAAGGSSDGGDIHITNHYTIGAGVNRAEVAQAVTVGNANLKADLMRQRSCGQGVFR